jgi:hypothetical protein
MLQIKYKALGTKGWAPTENNGWYYGSNNIDEILGEGKLHQHLSLAMFERNIQGNYLNKDTRCIFIGATDKNGTEMYSGDIVLAKRHGFEDGDICVIEYKPLSFVMKVITKDKEHYYAPRNYHQIFEVIGNIYRIRL